jgi:hypothetical protein
MFFSQLTQKQLLNQRMKYLANFLEVMGCTASFLAGNLWVLSFLGKP